MADAETAEQEVRRSSDAEVDAFLGRDSGDVGRNDAARRKSAASSVYGRVDATRRAVAGGDPARERRLITVRGALDASANTVGSPRTVHLLRRVRCGIFHARSTIRRLYATRSPAVHRTLVSRVCFPGADRLQRQRKRVY